MRSLSLMLSRMCISLWCGAGMMFVVLLLALRSSPLFDNEIKLDQAKVLFPWFYGCEFALLAGALVFGALAGRAVPRRQVYLALVATALALAIGDHFWIYRPLESMLHQPALPMNFRDLHHLSRTVNTVNLGLCLIAALLIQWPSASEQPRIEESTPRD